MRCARENSAEHVQSIQCVRWPWWRQVENHMLLVVGAVTMLSAVVIIPRMRVPGGVNASTLDQDLEVRDGARVPSWAGAPDRFRAPLLCNAAQTATHDRVTL